jgi:hypothetical protein
LECAEKFKAQLEDRLKSFGIELNSDKTTVLPAGSGVAADFESRGQRLPGFSFLGFRHVWGKSLNRRQGVWFWRVKLRTCSIRLKAKLKKIKEFVKSNRHDWNLVDRIGRTVKGYCAYFAVNDNQKRVSLFVYEVKRILFKYLNRRSQKPSMNWEQFVEVLKKANFPTQVPRLKSLFFDSSRYGPRAVRC